MSNTKKITKAQRNTDIMALLRGEKPEFGTTIEEAIKHLTHENELLANKNKPGGDKKLTKKQERNEVFKAAIMEFLSVQPNRLITATELMSELLVPTFTDELWSNQRAASLLNALADKYDKDGELTDDSGKLFKTPAKGKNKTTFQIKPEYVVTVGEEEEEMEEESAETDIEE